MKYLLSILLALGTMSAFAQMGDELGFIYVKADYMLETGRYAEAAAEFEKVIAKDPSFKEVLLKKAECLYHLGKYEGAETSVLDAFHFNGVTATGIKLIALCQAASRNYLAANNSIETALQLNYKDAAVQEAKGEILLAQEDFDGACDAWANAEKMGSEKARLQRMKYCKGSPGSGGGSTTQTPKTSPTGTGKPGKVKIPTSKYPKTNTKDEVIVQRPGGTTGNEPNPEVDIEPEVRVDDSVKKIKVDDGLSLEIRNGIGSRKVLEQPDIFILSQETGSVIIDICINSRGKVETATLSKDSEITTSSLTSLALRKSKDFWFEKHDDKNMCGSIVYKFVGM